MVLRCARASRAQELRYNSKDKEMRDLLTSSITMTDLKISQAEAH